MTETDQPLRWRDALASQLLNGYRAPVISNYRLAVELFTLAYRGEYDGRLVKLPQRGLDIRMFYEARTALKSKSVLTTERGLPSSFMRMTGRRDADPTETLCTIDPFGYLAFLSAMSIHGLSNRLPKILYYVTPDIHTWGLLAKERMQKDLGDHLFDYKRLQLPELHRPTITKLEGMVIHLMRTKELGGWRHLREESIRVATLGRTFLQMLQRPDLCGGIRHVIEVFEEHGKTNLQSIVAEFNQNGTKVDRVRAGYLLNERCGITDERVESWVQFAARGGSRKLDAQAEYQPTFSEKWCLSINV